MRILLAGGSGFIGAALRESVADGHHEIVRLVRHPTTEANTVTWDPKVGEMDRAALERCGAIDAIINLSGAGIGDHRWNEGVKRDIKASRLTATTFLAALAVELDPAPGVFLSASGISYYGECGSNAVTEDSPPGMGFLPDLCQEWEAAAAPVADVMRLVTLRTAVILSRRGGALAKQLPIFRFGLGGRLGQGGQYLSWISMADHLAVVERVLADDSLVGPVNSTAPQPATNAAFTQALAAVLHRPHLFTVPTAALKLALGPEMAEALLLHSTRVLPARLTEAGFTFTQPDVRSALAWAVNDT